MAKYKKKPLIIEAVQWLGNNEKEILDFCKGRAKLEGREMHKSLYILTIEGNMYANVGDYIIRGIKGEYYPCNKDVFRESYTFISKQ